jgi:NAD(P)H-flavin reductase
MPDAVAVDEYVRVKVARAWDETAHLRRVAVALGALGAQHRVAGQVVKLRVSGVGESYFALATAPADGGAAELLLKRGGAVADAVIAAEPDEVELTAPFGRGFPVESGHGRDVLLFAAGSGIAPMRALVQHVILARARFGRVDLFYGQREDGDFAYRGDYDAWQRAGVRVVECASRPSAAWAGGRGHVQDVARAIGFGDVRVDNAVAFVCGMKPMVAGVRELLGERGVAAERVFLNF